MQNFEEVYLTDYVRTPFSRSRPPNAERSAFSEVRGDHLVGFTLRNMFEERLKGKVKPEEVSEFLLGCSLPVGTQWAYAGRNAWFAGNMPASVPSVVFDRACGSAMTAMHHGIMSIQTGNNDIVVASGFENMFIETMNPTLQKSIVLPQDLVAEAPGNIWYRDDIDIMTGFQMVQTAQKLFEEEADKITIEEMDHWGVRSHNLAEKALNEGYFKGEIIPVMGHKEGDLNEPMLVEHDLSIRKGTTYEKTAQLPPVSTPGFRGGYKNAIIKRKNYKERFGTNKGAIKAGSSSPLNAGAATCMLMSKTAMEAHNITPMAKIISMGWAGVDPSVMGRGPVPATEKALKMANLKAEEIDYWEINEAFSVVALNAIKSMNINPDRVNVKGGAIAIGHPLAASGVRLPATLARILNEKKARYGCANLCCGSGQGVALVIENTNL
ncbi:3-ketoacyl-CoA thiolase [Candidatus Lokiarchaeum ossiferum]|uniref:3-ketoacyl-CoA thiolase n=1 Tax=Candidatus Lokiarchaeum ossiferum TaxID=2951803 RepID=A0ABY6HRC0_9ARCH|nr:3-ketoacyl-CoA thiolase [Candidatus Lokiarchaeum sp. B-35]